MAEQRMQEVVHRSHGLARIESVPVGARHLHLQVEHRVGEIYVIVSRSGDEEFYRTSRVQRGHGLMFHHVTFGDAVLSGGYGKEIQLGLDSLARLSMHESHLCRRRICRPRASWTSVSCGVALLQCRASVRPLVLYVYQGVSEYCSARHR